ncbi:hypothetical protein [Nocardia jejuensis]|uniref:hypothetical protein n=1 Tax=Nocardia jejuensis TaxID=328049 RepID=UPI0008301C89|nr:hypothetical protein [Nocardia jejuensis]
MRVTISLDHDVTVRTCGDGLATVSQQVTVTGLDRRLQVAHTSTFNGPIEDRDATTDGNKWAWIAQEHLGSATAADLYAGSGHVLTTA